MKKLATLLCVCCFVSNLFSQDVLATFINNMDDNDLAIKEVIPVVNHKTNDISLFVLNSKQVFGYLLNENFELEKSLSSEDRRRKYTTLIGYGIKDRFNYDIILTNNKKTKFATVNFSFSTGVSELKEFELENYTEKFVQTVTINNTCYLITIEQDSNILKIYHLDGLNSPKINLIDFSNENFVGRAGNKTNLYSLFKITSKGAFVDIETPKIDYELPNAIEVVSEEKKLYISDQKIVFTFDVNKDLTQILTINPLDSNYSFKTYRKDLLAVDQSGKKSNSFLDQDIFYTVEVSKDSLGFQAKDFNSREIIKQILLSKYDSIDFKNTSIIQEGGAYDSYRELESTQKFLRKLRTADIGISAYKQKDIYEITIGSKKDLPKSGGMMMPMGGFGGIPIGAIGSINMFFNPAFFAYNSYNGTKSTYIKSIFDSDFNHIKGDLNKNIFDMVNDYTENRADYLNTYKIPANQPGSEELDKKNKLNIYNFKKSAETIFKYKNYLIFGEYNLGPKVYILRQFKTSEIINNNQIVN